MVIRWPVIGDSAAHNANSHGDTDVQAQSFQMQTNAGPVPVRVQVRNDWVLRIWVTVIVAQVSGRLMNIE